MQDLIKIIAMGKTFCRHKIEVQMLLIDEAQQIALTTVFNFQQQLFEVHMLPVRQASCLVFTVKR